MVVRATLGTVDSDRAAGWPQRVNRNVDPAQRMPRDGVDRNAREARLLCTQALANSGEEDQRVMFDRT